VTTTYADSRWMGGECPFAAGWKKVMMWVFIIGDAILFAGFLSAYGYARAMAPDWPAADQVFNLGLIGMMTFVLISSSATMAAAVAMAKVDRARASMFLWATVVGGLVFLSMQAYEWSHLIAEGGRPGSNPWGAAQFGAYFFIITGFHGTHVLIGVIINLVTALRTKAGITPAENVEMAGLYWHFVDLVWVFIFTLFYLL